MTRIDRHLLARFASASALMLVLLGLVFVTLDFSEHVDDFMDRGAPWDEVFRVYYLNYLYEIVRLTSPLAVFLGAIYTVARLAQSLQIAALHAAGVSLGRIVLPFAAVGVLFSVAMVAFNGFVVPPAVAVRLDFANRYLNDAPEQTETADIYRQAAPGVVLGVGYFDRTESRAYRVSLVTEDTTGNGHRLARRLDASEMTFVDSLGLWQLRDVVERRIGADGTERFLSRSLLDTTLALTPADLALSDRDADKRTIPETRAYLASLRRAGVTDLGRPLVSYHTTFAYPMANLVLILIAVPLAARRRRGGQAAHLAAGLAVAFFYLATQRLVEPLGYVGALAPAVAAWLPHGVFLVVAVAMLVRAGRV